VPLSGTSVVRTFTSVLLRGLLAGLVAGLLAGAFAYVAGEPHVEAAIAVEERAAHADPAAGDHHEEPLVGRDGQRAGLLLATGLFGAAMGGLLATAYALLRRRLRIRDDAHAALALAGAALLGGVVVPFVKYPANPPAVGNPDTIGQRTGGYLAMVILGVVAVWAGALAYRTTRARWDGIAPGLSYAAAAAAFLLVTAVAYAALPSVDEVPDGFPASLLWDFRLASLGTQVVLWTGIGLVFAGLLHAPGTETCQSGRPD
jgi:hypothetical protein